MYHAMVKRIARKNFLRVNEKDFDALLGDCAPGIHHRFGGSHALGGERHDKGRADALVRPPRPAGASPDAHGRGRVGQGPAYDTTVITRWSATDELPDGSPYRNRGVHIVRMRWGKVIDIDVHEDSQAVAANLARQAELGVAEAIADPIVS